MDFIAFIAMIGFFGGFIWKHFGQSSHITSGLNGSIHSKATSAVRNIDDTRSRLSCSYDCDDSNMVVNEESHHSFEWVTDPTYFWMPGNIFYQETTSFDDVSSSGYSESDWMTDPAYSQMSGNIFHDDSLSRSCTESDWMTDPACSCMLGNIYHDDHCTSSYSSDDSWNSSGCSDDSWCSNSLEEL